MESSLSSAPVVPSPTVQDQTSSPKNYWVYIGGGVLLAVLLGISIYFYFTSSKQTSTSPSPSTPSPYSPSPSPSPSDPTPSPNPYISVVSPCGKYEDEAGIACSQDGIKAYNNALASQLNYICQANGKQNQYAQCMQMCQNGQFNGLPMCRSCCTAVCSTMVCPQVGRGSRGLGEAGGGNAECATICRLQPNSDYCKQCSKA